MGILEAIAAAEHANMATAAFGVIAAAVVIFMAMIWVGAGVIFGFRLGIYASVGDQDAVPNQIFVAINTIIVLVTALSLAHAYGSILVGTAVVVVLWPILALIRMGVVRALRH